MTEPSLPKPTVAVLYGACEGRRNSKRFRTALAQAGFTLATDAKSADILIAHSGGIFYLPKEHQAKLTLLIGPVLPLKKPLAKIAFRKLAVDVTRSYRQRQLGRLFGNYLLNAGYLVAQPHRIAYMWKQAKKQGGRLPIMQSDKASIIMFRDDPWSKGITGYELHLQHHYTFMHFDRLHDDIWINPKDYVAVIQYLYAS